MAESRRWSTRTPSDRESSIWRRDKQQGLTEAEEGARIVGSSVELFRKELTAGRDHELGLQEDLQREFGSQFKEFWTFAQQEMVENKNEEFGLSREVNKLSNEIKALQTQIEAAEAQLRQVERVTGMRGMIG